MNKYKIATGNPNKSRIINDKPLPYLSISDKNVDSNEIKGKLTKAVAVVKISKNKIVNTGSFKYFIFFCQNSMF